MAHLQDIQYLQTLLQTKREQVTDVEELAIIDRLLHINKLEIREYSRLEPSHELVNDKEYFRHESYGSLKITNGNSGNGNLYGCSVLHNQQVFITLSRSEYCRSLGHDYYHPFADLFHISMSREQFGQFVCSVGQGEGVPVTITRIGMRSISSPPFINKVTMVKEQFKRQMATISSKIRKVSVQVDEVLLAKGPISVQQRGQIASTLKDLTQEINSNLPFVVDCYDETTGKILNEAKIALDTLIRASNNIQHDQLPVIPHNLIDDTCNK